MLFVTEILSILVMKRQSQAVDNETVASIRNHVSNSISAASDTPVVVMETLDFLARTKAIELSQGLAPNSEINLTEHMLDAIDAAAVKATSLDLGTRPRCNNTQIAIARVSVAIKTIEIQVARPSGGTDVYWAPADSSVLMGVLKTSKVGTDPVIPARGTFDVTNQEETPVNQLVLGAPIMVNANEVGRITALAEMEKVPNWLLEIQLCDCAAPKAMTVSAAGDSWWYPVKASASVVSQ